MVKSVFSNGVVDIYKGNRDVKAGWIIVNIEDGSVWDMGHSLDRIKAEKTARGNLPRLHAYYKGRNGAYERKLLAKKWGCNAIQAVAKADAENAAHQAKFKIEVVDVAE